MLKKYLLIGLAFFSSLEIIIAVNNTGPKTLNGIKSNQTYFIENKGQICNQTDIIRNDVKFIGVTPFENVIFTDHGVSHQLTKCIKSKNENQSYRVDLRWVNSNKDFTIKSNSIPLFYTNYYNLNHTKLPILKVKNYSSILIKNIYDGIDVKYYENGSTIEHDYILKPGADYTQIQINIEGGETFLNENGDLSIKSPLGLISESSPKVFQNGKIINSKWIQINKNTFGFKIDAFDITQPLVIDPITRVWGTYYGDSETDAVNKSCFDAQNNIYISGGTKSTNNIATNGSFQSTYTGNGDGIILKMTSTGKRIWCTYVGGNYADVINGIKLDKNNKLYIIGETLSDNNIATSNSFKSYHNSKNNVFTDGFIMKFDTTGTRIWGTFFGGNYGDTYEYFNDFTIDSKCNLIIVGYAESKWLGTPGAYSQYMNVNNTYESIIVKFDSSGQRIFCSYYTGSNGGTTIDCITLGKNDSFYIGGKTSSTQGIATNGTYFQAPRGADDFFINKFSPNCTKIWGTYLGGSNNDYLVDIVADKSDNLYIFGGTYSKNILTSRNIYQDTAKGDRDGVIAKFNSRGLLLWCTYYGGEHIDEQGCITIYDDKTILLCGQTFSKFNISTKGTFQDSLTPIYSEDGYLAKFDSTGNIIWGTYYGGSENDYIYQINSDFNGSIYIFGGTYSKNKITTKNSFSDTLKGAFDGFIVKFGDCKATTSTINKIACKQYTWNNKTYTSSGTYTLNTNNYKGCDSIVTLNLTIKNNTSSIQKITSCDSIIWYNKVIKNNISFFDTLQNSQQCDSIIEYQFYIKKSSSNYINITACDSFVWKNKILTKSTSLKDTLKNFIGCDSFLTINLTINNRSSSINKIKVCKNYLWQGNLYTQTGIYQKHFLNSKNCDSTVWLDLTIGGFVYDTTTENSCKKSFNWKKHNYGNTGWYYDTAKAMNACDTIHCLYLNLNPLLFTKQPNTQFINLNDTAKFIVSSNDTFVNYKWQIDTGSGWFTLDNSTLIKGYNNDTLTVYGKYLFDGNKIRCILYFQNCADTSDSVNIFICPRISKQPIKKYVGKGNSTVFSVACDIPNAKFQWQANSGNGYFDLTNDQMYTGVNDSVLYINNIQTLTQTIVYRCLVKTKNCSTLSDTVILLVLLEVRKNLCNELSFVNVYPNPTKHYVNVILPSDKVGLPYKIIADHGGIVKLGTIQSEESKIDFTDYTSGVYLLVIGYDLLDCFKIVKITD